MIELRDIQKYYIEKRRVRGGERIYAVNNISAKFNDGNVYAIFGNSGSGKTTLGSMISGYVQPDSGEIYYDNSRIRTKKSVRHVFQDPYASLNGAKDVTWHIETTAGLNDLDEENVWKVYENSGLSREDYRNRLVWTLSGGEKQILAFSMALAQKPSCIVLDEPFSFLDTMTLCRELNLIKQTRDKILYIYLDNDMNRCAYVSDFIHVMKEGKIIDSGSTESVISSPENDFTRQIIENMPDIEKRIE